MDEQEQRLVSELDAAALFKQPLAEPLLRIQRQLHSNIAAFVLREPLRDSCVETLITMNASAEATLSYEQHFHKVDFLAPRALLKPPGVPFSSDELVTEQVLAQSELFNDWMLPNQMQRFLGFWAALDEGPILAVGLQRPPGSGLFHSDDHAFLARLIPHLRRSLSIYWRLRPFGGSVQQLIAHLPHAALLIDSRRFCIGLNASAQQMARAGFIRLSQGYLSFPNVDELGWGRALRGGGFLFLPSAGGYRAHAVKLSALSWPLPNSWFLVELLRAEARQFHALLAQDDFGLTPAETSLASYLVEGYSLQEIAKQRGIALSTLRSQLKALLHKTDTARQAEVVAKLSRYCL